MASQGSKSKSKSSRGRSSSSKSSNGRRSSSRSRSSGNGSSSSSRSSSSSSRSRQKKDTYPDYSVVDPKNIPDGPDVLIDVPVVKVDVIDFELDDLRAQVAVRAEVKDMVQLSVGADVLRAVLKAAGEADAQSHLVGGAGRRERAQVVGL